MSSTYPIQVRMVSLASSVLRTRAKMTVPSRTPGMEPAESQPTRPQCTVRARMWTNDPTGFMIAEATTSLDTAAAGRDPEQEDEHGGDEGRAAHARSAPP